MRNEIRKGQKETKDSHRLVWRKCQSLFAYSDMSALPAVYITEWEG